MTDANEAKPAKYNPKTWAEMTTPHKIGVVAVLLLLAFALSTCFMPEPEKTPEEQKAAVLKYYGDTFAASRPCDRASATYEPALERFAAGKVPAVEMYQLAQTTKGICEQARDQMLALEAPKGLSVEAAALAAKADLACNTAGGTKVASFEASMVVINGDTRPATLSAFVDKSRQVENDLYACVGGLTGLAMSVGLTADELSPLTKK